MSNSSLVWFHLYGSDGMPYKETSADYVMLPPGYVVAQFRDAVKAKNSNKLASVDAGDLTVFKNKAAFESKVSKNITHYRKCRWKKILGLMVWDRQRRKH